MNDSINGLKRQFDEGIKKVNSNLIDEKKEVFNKYCKEYLNNFSSNKLSMADRNILSFQVTKDAAKSFFTQKDCDTTFVDHNNLILVRMIYNLNNKVKPSMIVGFCGIANGITYEAKEYLGGDEVYFSHVKKASSGAISGCKVRATILFYKIEKSDNQLPDNGSHNRYFDIFLDPFSDFKTSIKLIGADGKCGDYGEYSDLKLRPFSKPTNENALRMLEELKSTLSSKKEEGERLLKSIFLGE